MILGVHVRYIYLCSWIFCPYLHVGLRLRIGYLDSTSVVTFVGEATGPLSWIITSSSSSDISDSTLIDAIFLKKTIFQDTYFPFRMAVIIVPFRLTTRSGDGSNLVDHLFSFLCLIRTVSPTRISACFAFEFGVMEQVTSVSPNEDGVTINIISTLNGHASALDGSSVQCTAVIFTSEIYIVNVVGMINDLCMGVGKDLIGRSVSMLSPDTLPLLSKGISFSRLIIHC